MRISDRGLEIIKEFEGFRARAYICPAGVWTIGYGHTRGVKAGDVVTEQQATELLRNDAKEAEEAVTDLVKVELSQWQFDALVSLVYNIGSGNFYNSTICRLLNEGCDDEDRLRHAWCMWKRAGGRTLSGLIRRREKEFKLFTNKL